MRHNNRGRKLGRMRDSRNALLRGLATNFVLYEKIETTIAKAKEIRPLVEKIITMGKDNSLHNRRQVMKLIYTENATKKVLEDLGPRYKERNGGYTRIIKLGPRKGDGAEMALIELV